MRWNPLFSVQILFKFWTILISYNSLNIQLWNQWNKNARFDSEPNFSTQTSSDNNVMPAASGALVMKCLCDKSFGRKGNLEKHITAVHEGTKNYSCDFCDKSFGHKHTLGKQITTVHEGIKKYPCDFFDKSFGHKGHLGKHIAALHQDSLLWLSW